MEFITALDVRNKKDTQRLAIPFMLETQKPFNRGIKMTILDEAKKLRALIEQMAENLDDETAEQNPNVFPNWEVGVEYKVDYKVRYNDVVYKVLQAHTSQADWTPDVAVSLFVKVHKQDPQDEFPDWVQPTGAHDAYEYGEKVSHLLKEDGTKRHWISTFKGANVWEPGSVGTEALWREIENQ
jgi:hypothetical protein